jgi:hypothetical protein
MRKKSAEKTAEEKENINTQRRKKLAEKTVTGIFQPELCGC